MNPTGWPIRTRLTVLYAGAFLAAGAVIIAVTYALVSRSLRQPARLIIGADGAPLQDGLTGTPGTVADRDAMLVVRQSIEQYRQDTLNDLLTWSVVALAAALVLAVGLGWALAGRALKPLQQITDTARRVQDRSLHERIAMTGPDDEVRQLADTVDAMLERLDRSFDAQRRFVANASHELRTPLAVSRTLVEVALDAPEASDDLRQLAPAVLAMNERSERLVDDLLTLAQSEQVIERTGVDLADVAGLVVEQSAAEATERGVQVDLALGAAPVVGSRVLLERMAQNLVQNAIRHAGPASIARVSTGRENGFSHLVVENPGPVLSVHEVPGLFEPFRRGAGRVAGAGGTGLGLSIVRSVVTAHGGTVEAVPIPTGGLRVRVDLPAPGPHPPPV